MLGTYEIFNWLHQLNSVFIYAKLAYGESVYDVLGLVRCLLNCL